MPTPYTQLLFPTAGVVKRLSVQQQGPYTCPDALNVRPNDNIEGRERGGSRPALEKAFAEQLGSGNPIRMYADVPFVSGGSLTSVLVASANGKLYRVNAGSWQEVVSAVTLASDRQLGCAVLFQKLYICGDNSSNRSLCVYDPVANTLALAVATAGTIPTKCTLAAAWRGSLVLSGTPDDPQNAFISATGSPLDWDYAADTTQAAVALGDSEPGQLGEPVRALVAHSRNCLIFGCNSSLEILRGHPLTGGTKDRLSNDVGILDAHAWAYDAEGYLFFMTFDGLYVMPPGCGSTPSSVSREKLPTALLNLNRSTYTVSLAYDFAHRGLHLIVAPITAADTTHYWVATKTISRADLGGGSGIASFFPVTLQSGHDPFFAYSRRDSFPAAGESSVLLGCRDGYARRFNTDLSVDDVSYDFESYVDYGPIVLGPVGSEGRLSEIIVTTAEGSGDLDLEVRVGQTAQAALSADASYSYSFDNAALHHTLRPRARGAYCMLRFKNGQPDGSWAIEEVLVRREPAGKRRLRG